MIPAALTGLGFRVLLYAALAASLFGGFKYVLHLHERIGEEKVKTSVATAAAEANASALVKYQSVLKQQQEIAARYRKRADDRAKKLAQIERELNELSNASPDVAEWSNVNVPSLVVECVLPNSDSCNGIDSDSSASPNSGSSE